MVLGDALRGRRNLVREPVERPLGRRAGHRPRAAEAAVERTHGLEDRQLRIGRRRPLAGRQRQAAHAVDRAGHGPVEARARPRRAHGER